jgi:HAD superfamily hydrolase (TIGR01484 family)
MQDGLSPVYFLALATDYDGTIAHDGTVDAATCAALRRFKESGRRLLLVTGRQLPELMTVFPEFDMFDRVVAENGALVYDPVTRTERLIAPPPAPAFVRRLKELGVSPIAVGRSIVATWQPHETTVLQVIRDLGLELQIIFNKGAVMVLPASVNKAAGLAAALKELELSHHNVVGVGDAENDHAFLRACGCAAAVANALPTVKDMADVRLAGDHGAGVIELMDRMIRDEARLVVPERHGIVLGTDSAGATIHLTPYGGNVLIAGDSDSGDSPLATALIERMGEKGLEFCVFDPDGDYDELDQAVSVGDSKIPPKTEEALKLLRKLGANVVVDMRALGARERPACFARLLPALSDLRGRTGRPHWLLIDEAHHLLPARDHLSPAALEKIPSSVFVTTHPERVSPEALKTVSTLVACGQSGPEALRTFCRAIGTDTPADIPRPSDDELLVWRPGNGTAPRTIQRVRSGQPSRRHTHKDVDGDVGEARSFYFRGPDNRLKLRAQNLAVFLQIAEGVDDPTWEHHLRAGDYSAWFKGVIKNDPLAREAAEIERDARLSADESRRRIADAVARCYAGASKP